MPIDLRVAVERHRLGEFARAAAVYEAALAEDPDRHEALHLLALARLQTGAAPAALPLIDRAVTLAPDKAAYLVTQGEVHHALGMLELSVEDCKQALALEPDRADIYCNMGATLVDLDRIDEGIAAFQSALQLRPNLVAAHNNLGNAFQRKGNLDQALEHLRTAVHLDPRSADVRSNLAKLLMEQNALTEAFEHGLAAVRLRPEFPAGLGNLGNILALKGRLEEAEACFREAIRLKPDSASAYAGLGSVLEQRGDLEGSIAAYHTALRHQPAHAGTLGRLAARMRQALPDTDRIAIEDLLADPSLSPDQRRPLAFGFIQVLDALGDYNRAATLAREANALQLVELQRRGRAYSPAEHHHFVNQLIDAFTPEYFENVSGLGLETEFPVFIVGLPRSGTSLVEQILASHPQVYGGGELGLMNETFQALPSRDEPVAHRLKLLDRSTIQELANRHLDRLKHLGPGAQRIVDKMPENYQYLGLIVTLFPRARLIHCRRNLRDVALSCWLTDFGQVRWACDLDHIASHINEYVRLMSHWRKVLPVPILEVDYESIVDDLETEARKLVDWCGLEWNPACLSFHQTQREVRTVSATQVRRPIYSSSVGRWKNYEQTLESLFAGLDDERSA